MASVWLVHERCVDICLPCVVQWAVAHVTLSLGYALPAVGARLGGAQVVSQLAPGTVEESRTPAVRLCGVNKTPRHLRQGRLIKATASFPYRHKIIKAKVSKIQPKRTAASWCLKGKISFKKEHRVYSPVDNWQKITPDIHSRAANITFHQPESMRDSVSTSAGKPGLRKQNQGSRN